jgi:hypothetical protein
MRALSRTVDTLKGDKYAWIKFILNIHQGIHSIILTV